MSKESEQMFKNALASIRKELTPEEYGKIAAHLKTAEGEFQDVWDDFQHVYRETIDRKEKIRDKDREIEQLQDQLKSAKDNTEVEKIRGDLKAMKDENEKLKQFQSEIHDQQRSKFSQMYETHKNHGDFERVKPFLKIPDEKDGKPDWQSISIDEIVKNIAEIEKARAYGSFADVKIHQPGNSKIPPNQKTESPFSKFPGAKQ